MDLLKKTFLQFVEVFKKNILNNAFAYLIVGSILLIIYYIYDIKNYEIVKTLGSILVSAALFKFLLTGNVFLDIIKEELSKLLLFNENILKYFKLEEKDKIVKKLSNTVEKEKRELAINKTKEIYNKKNNNKNYIVQESFRTDTIYANGHLIMSFKIIAEIIKDGDFIFFYEIETDESKMPPLKDFENKNRFNDFSFYYKILNYKSRNSINERRNINMRIITNTEKKKALEFFINDTKEGDIITFMFSLSCPNEYNEQYINDIKNNKRKSGGKYRSLHAIRNITVQFENYESNNVELEPSIKIKDTTIEPLEQEEDIYYRRYKWKIYSYENEFGEIKFSLN